MVLISVLLPRYELFICCTYLLLICHFRPSYSKVVQGILLENDLSHDLKQGLHVRSELLLKQPIDPVEPVYLYVLDGKDPHADAVPEGKPVKGAPPPVTGPIARTGNDTVEVLAALWQEVECISMEDGVFGADNDSVRYFAKVNFTLFLLKNYY